MPNHGEASRIAAYTEPAQRRRPGQDEVLLQLRRALLPETAQRLATPLYDIAVRYTPAHPGHGVGGDWFDTRLRHDGCVLVTVGDAAGHGLDAAGRMARIGNAMRGLTWSCDTGDVTLTRLNELVCDQEDPETIASAVIGRLEPGEPVLHWAQAGHPHPVLVSGGEARLLDRPQGLMLGTTPAARYDEATAGLAPGDLLLFYTDGLIERRGHDIDEGIESLLMAATDCPAGTARQCVTWLLNKLGPAAAADDVCVLAVKVADPAAT